MTTSYELQNSDKRFSTKWYSLYVGYVCVCVTHVVLLLNILLKCITQNWKCNVTKQKKITAYLGFSKQRFNIVWLNSEDIDTGLDSFVPCFHLHQKKDTSIN